MPTFDPSYLIDRTFLLPPEENGERQRAKVTRQVFGRGVPGAVYLNLMPISFRSQLFSSILFSTALSIMIICCLILHLFFNSLSQSIITST